jgi:hypothetical protein
VSVGYDGIAEPMTMLLKIAEGAPTGSAEGSDDAPAATG